MGISFLPIQAEANIFSSLLGNNVSASFLSPDLNLQNISLLQANVSSASIFLKKENKEAEIIENTNVNIISDNALLPTTSSMGVLGATSGDSFSDEISVYVVRKGDSLAQIAQMFEVSTNTILWANDMKKGDAIKEGDILLILPVSGVKHIVEKGQTLKGISKKYEVDIAYIAGFNGIPEDAKLEVGDELIIPEAEMTEESENTNNKKTTNKKAVAQPSKVVSGYFINPVPGSIKTQGIHGKNAVDLGAPIGTPIYASAPGKVLLARYGWNGAYGNMILIQHSNGTQTLYSHLSSIATQTGASVNRGELIGRVGNTGRVRASPGGNGAHLHFEVHGAKNPGANGSWAK